MKHKNEIRKESKITEVDGPHTLVEKRPSERRRLPRVNLTSEQFKLAQNGKIFSVLDLSEGGMAVRMIDPDDHILFTVGAEVKGTLRLLGQKWPVTARVRHTALDHVGCQFEKLALEVQAAIRTFVDPHMLGASLRPFPPGNQASIWYHGASGTEFLLWRGIDGQCSRFLVLVRGSFIEWTLESLRTGEVGDDLKPAETQGVVQLNTATFYPDAVIDAEKIQIAKTLLLSSKLSQDLKTWCARQLASS